MTQIIRYLLRRKEEPILDEDVMYLQSGDDRECFNLGDGNSWKINLEDYEDE